MPYGLPALVLDRLTALFRKNLEAKNLWLYGSRSVGSEKPGSDIDLCLDAPSLTIHDLARLETEIDDLMLPWKVDLSLLHEIDGHGTNPTHRRRIVAPDREREESQRSLS